MSLSLAIERFHFAFARTVGDARRGFSAREGLEVALLVDGRPRGVGEASPLPRYSDDSIDECEHALRSMPSDRLASVLAAIRAGRFDRARGETASLPPAARFAVESVCLETCALERGISVAAFLGGDSQRLVVPALLVDPYDDRGADAIVAAARTRGCGAVKLKIGVDRAREVALATELRRGLGAAVELRFDANRSLRAGPDDAFLRSLVELGPCLVEEPFATDDLSHAVGLGLPLALDESLRSLASAEVAKLLASGAVAALVLKPTVLGLLGALGFEQLARESGRRAIPSHTYEGPNGRRMLSEFARCCADPFPGLDERAVRPPARGPSVAH